MNKNKKLKTMVGKYKGQGGSGITTNSRGNTQSTGNQSIDDYNKSIRGMSEGYKQPIMPSLQAAAGTARQSKNPLKVGLGMGIGAYYGAKNVVNKGKAILDNDVVNPTTNMLRGILKKFKK